MRKILSKLFRSKGETKKSMAQVYGMTRTEKWHRCGGDGIRRGGQCKACDEIIASGNGITNKEYFDMIDATGEPLNQTCANRIKAHTLLHGITWKKYYKDIPFEHAGKLEAFRIVEINP
jgi:hypothetical protein